MLAVHDANESEKSTASNSEFMHAVLPVKLVSMPSFTRAVESANPFLFAVLFSTVVPTARRIKHSGM